MTSGAAMATPASTVSSSTVRIVCFLSPLLAVAAGVDIDSEPDGEPGPDCDPDGVIASPYGKGRYHQQRQAPAASACSRAGRPTGRLIDGKPCPNPSPAATGPRTCRAKSAYTAGSLRVSPQ